MTWNIHVVLLLFISSFLHLCYGVCLQRGYQAADLSVVYPIARGTGPLLATAGAFLWMGEQATLSGLVGIVCVVGGVLLIATQARWRTSPNPPAWPGGRWGPTLGFLIAMYTLEATHCSKSQGVSPG